MVTEDDILDAVSFAMGNPSITEYPLSAKQSALRRGLNTYSQYNPIKKVGRFTTVANQQEYDIASTYSYLVSVDEVFYGATEQDLTGFYGNVYDRLVQISELQGMDIISNESLRVIDDRNMSVIEASQRYDYEMVDDFVVALIPTPLDVRNVYFSYSTIKAVSDLREVEFQDVVDFTFLIAAMDLANKRHKILQVNEPASGFVMFQGGKFLEMQVEKARVRLQQKYGIGAIAIHG